MDVYLNNIINKLSNSSKITDKEYINNQFKGIYDIIKNDKLNVGTTGSKMHYYFIDLLITIFKDNINKKPMLTDIINVELVDKSESIINNEIDLDKLDLFLDQQTEIIMQLLLDLRNNI